jgi:hypothetical protein
MIKSEIATKASRKSVEEFLEKHQIAHSFFVVRNDDFEVDGTAAAKMVGLEKNDIRIWVRGTIFDAEEDFLARVRIHIYFFFDEQDRLITFLVKRTSYGL